MFYRIKGILLDKSPNSTVVDISGIALEMTIAISTYTKLPEIGESLELYTSLLIRDDTPVLFAFKTLDEKEMFHLLTKVSSIGPRLAINILSGIDTDRLRYAIANKDTGILSSIPGIGKKTAERIILELKDKIDKSSFVEASTNESFNTEIFSALSNLGYKKHEIKSALESIPKEIKGFEEILKSCLKTLSKL
ncbi:MAG: Holliday junction branch migration protein RuvA [Deferribacterota bacterium]|nr:Holliday junction branch migration protein RuvA [Deferribacterota bacterium]